ncbi:MAG: carbamoyl-phosphate synthase large subunit [Planctomycetes bacterium]|nr:carbamoyl-phosphate synthase large subunit [Planctomycetota bacterium]
MPRNNAVKKVLVIGSGPTSVSHGTHLTRAVWKTCRLLKSLGFTVVALDSNPAALALDDDACHQAYIEPLTTDTIKRLLEKERPDALLPFAGGQNALNLCVELADELQAAQTQVLGISPESINAMGDRAQFAELVKKAGGNTLPSQGVASPEQAAAAAQELGFPLVLRPFFSTAGTGSSVVYNLEELKDATFRAIKNSPTAATLVERAALGWKELTCHVLRDHSDHALVAGVIEDVDPMGVHSGDSVTVFPCQTLTEQQRSRIAKIATNLAHLTGIAGGADVEFAVNPEDPGDLVVIKMNGWITTSSRMIFVATGFSTLEAAVKLALGESLASVCPAAPEPAAIAVKAPRFSFEKFPGAKIELNTSMKSIGQSVALGATFREALQKALRGPVGGRDGFGYDDLDRPVDVEDSGELRKKLSRPHPDRYFQIKSAFDLEIGASRLASITGINAFFLEEMKALVDTARKLSRNELSGPLLRKAKADGFSDRQIAGITGKPPEEIAALRRAEGVVPAYPAIGGNVRYASFAAAADPIPQTPRTILMIGPGPNSIGSGSEYEYCVSRASAAFRELGYRCVSVNCSIQGPSTDPELWDTLCVVPLCPEDVLAVAHAVKPEGVSVQFGGRVALRLAHVFEENGFNILGTAPQSHRRCHRRELRREMLGNLGMLQPKDAAARDLDEARAAAQNIGYPVVVVSRQPTPGKAMEVVYNQSDLEKSVEDFQRPANGGELLISEFLEDAIEVEVDAIADGESLLIGGVVEHIEEAGIHSGDSACAIPPYTVSEPVIRQMREQVHAIAAELGVRGMLNVQFAIKNDLIYVTEVVSSASLTVPFVSRAVGLPLVSIAAKVTAGVSLKEQARTREQAPRQMAVRHSVFPFSRFPGADAVLGPEMKSTGQVMGISNTFGLAFAKAVLGADRNLPLGGKVFISLKNKDKRPMLFVARKLEELGFELIATRGTASALAKNDVDVEPISKVSEGRPNIVDLIKNDEVSLIINTPSRKTPTKDEVSIRASAVAHNVPIITTVSGASAAVNAIEMVIKRGLEIESR